MDANGSRYHLILGRQNWGACLDSLGAPLSDSWKEGVENKTRLSWDPENAHLILQPLLYYYVASPSDSLPGIDDRRGAAQDALGNWYWISPSRQSIRIVSAGSRKALNFYPVPEPFACPPTSNTVFQPEAQAEPATELTFSGLAITENQYLVVGVLEPAGLLIFDLIGGGQPVQSIWPAAIPFEPFDLSPAPGGGLWILDRSHKRYWALDRFFNVIAQDQDVQPGLPPEVDTFQPLHGPQHTHPVQNFPAGIRIEDSTHLITLEDPISIEGLPDCTVLILDRKPSAQFSEVSRFRYGKMLGSPVSLSIVKDLVEESISGEFTLTAHDFAFVSEHDSPDGKIPDRLYIASSGGNQTFVFMIEGNDTSLTLTPLPEIYLPMRLFSGKALVASQNNVYYDLNERWLPLVQQLRPRYHTQADLYHTVDSHLPNCKWHRLMLDACLPPDTSVVISSRAADTPEELDLQPWQVEITYLRGGGSELPYDPNHFQSLPQPGGPRPPVPLGAGTWELLFQRASGQLLQLHIELIGNGQRTPRLRAVRIYYPRFSYLDHYLPAAYRQDSTSASFLDRFLANPEGFNTAIEDKVVNVRQLFDVASTPPETLDWLASWFGAVLDPGWSEYRRRLFIRYAMLFYQYRGTLRGLRMALRLALDDCPGPELFNEPCCSDTPAQSSALRIVESFRSRLFPAILLGDPSQVNVQAGPASSQAWTPEQGGAVLNQWYNQASGLQTGYPIRQPAGDATGWQSFSSAVLGFVPASSASDWNLWQAYLMRSYGIPQNLNAAYGLDEDHSLASFDEVVLPSDLPPDGPPLEDWYNFETVYLPLVRNAHHFVVLLPMKSNLSKDSAAYQDRLTLTKKVIELEKPAHTTYDIRLFWALFRIGEARLGLDTTLDVGSRNPNFPAPFIIGQEFLAEGYLDSGQPPLPSDRIALGAGCIPSDGKSTPPPARPSLRYAKTTSRCSGQAL